MDELRDAIRQLWRSKASSSGLIALLALSMSVGICVFAVAWTVLWKPLPFPDADRLVNLTLRSSKMGIDLGWSAPYLDHVVRNGRQLEKIAAYRQQDVLSADDQGRPLATLKAIRAQPQLLELLGARPISGRLFVDHDAQPGADRVALVSERYWRDRLGSLEALESQRLYLEGESYRIVGVLPSAFAFPSPSIDVWLPFGFAPADVHISKAGSFGSTRAIARLAASSTPGGVGSEIVSLVFSESGLRPIAEQIGLQFDVKPIRSIWSEDRRGSLVALLIAAGLLLSVAIVNSYSLFLVRQLKRRQEFAVLEAVGETSARRTRRVTIEAAALVTASLVIVCLLIPVGIAGLARLDVLPEAIPQPAKLDWATFSAMVAVGCVAAVALGSTALSFRKQSVYEVLRQTGNGQSLPKRVLLQKKILVAGQIAVVFVLLFVTALLMRSSHQLLSEDVGFDRSDSIVGVLRPAVAGSQASPELMRTRLNEWLGIVEQLPGVVHAGLSSAAPFGEVISLEAYRTLAGTTLVAGAVDQAYVAYVSGDYPSALGLRLLNGRNLDRSDAQSQSPVALIDRSLAERHFSGSDPVGQMLTVGGGESGARQVSIVGVVSSVRQRDLAKADEYPTIYMPMEVPIGQVGMPQNSVEFVIRGGDSQKLIDVITESTAQLTPNLRLADTVSMKDRINETIADRIRLNKLLQVLSLTALVLSSAGLYALLSHVVMSRSRELAVRKALGATPMDLLRATFVSGFSLVFVGVLCGLPFALLCASALKSRLYQTSPTDLAALFLVLLLLGVVGAAANLVPARKAASVHPNQVLREG